MNYLLKQATTKKTPQSKAIPGREKEMHRNDAGGFSFNADSWTLFERFILLGAEGGSYYVGESDLTEQNVDNVRACIAKDGLRAVQTITDISVAGRAPKNDPALYALALAASYGPDLRVREAALAALPKVARTGTHLFPFVSFVDSMRGWSNSLRRAVSAWYLDKPISKIAYQVVKYQNREGWAHRDVFRLAHPKPKPSHETLFTWAVKGAEGIDPETMPALVEAFERAKGADEKTVIGLIREHGLTREMIPTEVQKSPKVWEALFEKMPLTAMIRTLGRMSASGLLAPLSETAKEVVRRLGNQEYLRTSRVHPIAILGALLTYGQGRGVKGSLTWTVVPQVVAALDAAFYMAFDNVQPTGKNFYLGVDVSSSMTAGEVAGMAGLTPNMGAAAMAMLVARKEENYFIGGFANSFVDLKISKSDSLQAAMQKCQRDFGGTDCATPIKHALDRKYPVDAFVVITDGMTWAGDIHASQAIQHYRDKMGRDAKLIVMNMVANKSSLVDPKDSGSFDLCGFDATIPVLINSILGVGQNRDEENKDDQ